jgi:CBS domain-containing protein
MATRNIGSLVVVGADDQLIGVVGERDIVQALDHHGPRSASCACATS